MDDDTKFITVFGAIAVLSLVAILVANTLPDYLVQAKCIDQRGNWASDACVFVEPSE